MVSRSRTVNPLYGDLVLSGVSICAVPTLLFLGRCLTAGSTQALWEQSIIGCFPKFVFQFSMAQLLVGLGKEFINNFVFPTCACAAGFNNYNSNDLQKEILD